MAERFCQSAPAVRICIVYDCLYPCTVGGAERWYRNLAERLAGEGHEVTYLTLRQWPRGETPEVHAQPPGAGAGAVRVRSAGPRMELYAGDRRRILPPLVFGAGVLWHLLRSGRRYDVVHSASFPYFSLLAAGLARLIWRFELVVDWHEVWSREYWREYLGHAAGAVGYARAAALRAPAPARLLLLRAARRAAARGGAARRGDGAAGPVRRAAGARGGAGRRGLAGAARGLRGAPDPREARAARRRGCGAAAARVPGLRAVFYGDGPERARLLRAIDEDGVRGIVTAPGFAPAETVDADLSRATCLLLPSRREGYGKVVVEAAARGTPSIVVSAEDNAATELIEDGVNGIVVERADAAAVADAIVRVREAGSAMRESTARWYERNASTLSLESSLAAVLRSYAR